jgi:hypothetical protein
VNEQDNNRQDRDRSGDNRVLWSDLNGFEDVRVDARHHHPVRRKGKAMTWVIAILTGILIIELWFLLSPHENKSLLLRPQFDTERTDAR